MEIVNNWIKRTFADSQMVMLFVVLFLCFVGVILFAKMLAPAIAAVIIAFLLDGSVTWLRQKGLGHMWAASIVFVVFIAVSLIILFTIVPLVFKQIVQFVNSAPAMMVSLEAAIIDLQEKFPNVISPDQMQAWLSRIGNEIANMSPQILQYSLSGVAGLLTAAVYLVLVPVMVFFFLKDKERLLAWAASFFPTERGLITQVWSESLERAGDYARGKVYEIFIVGIAAFFVYQFLGLRFATLLAVVTGLSVLVPYIGAALVTLPVTLVAYVQWGFGADMVWAVVAYLILQALDGNVLVPFMFSEVVNLHPNAIIVAILVFGGIWGLWGVFFAIPLATMANAVIRAWKNRSHELGKN